MLGWLSTYVLSSTPFPSAWGGLTAYKHVPLLRIIFPNWIPQVPRLAKGRDARVPGVDLLTWLALKSRNRAALYKAYFVNFEWFHGVHSLIHYNPNRQVWGLVSSDSTTSLFNFLRQLVLRKYFKTNKLIDILQYTYCLHIIHKQILYRTDFRHEFYFSCLKIKPKHRFKLVIQL